MGKVKGTTILRPKYVLRAYMGVVVKFCMFLPSALHTIG